MPASTGIPTSLRGRVSDNDYEAILDELTAGLPADLVWPNSVYTYATMGRDSTVDAVLQGYTLQLRRATWQMSGRDCNPRVVEQVATDMDLPIVGAEVTGATRVRGVSWPEHLRAALHSKLLYGHMGFELGAKIADDGLARLTMLAERLPQTITQIHADPKSGEFLGITQDAARRDGKPQIPARQMAWYCRDRVGTAWQGVSLFRASWPAWLVKREMIRVHATSNRRFGMGVPVNDALPGTNPSPEQMTKAQQMASAARVGETAGAVSPPGFTFRLVGLSGGVPDTLAFIRWLDSQITRAALMPHLELGQNNNGGARALGEAFIDSWTLALESLAEEAAVVASRQISARLVEWNHGEDEPVPRVRVSGVGSRREVTAESLNQLLSSGALQADPALESWIRREYHLPEREGMPLPAPSVRGDTVAAANRPRRRERRQPSGDQLELPIAAAAAGPNPQPIQDVWEQARADLLAQWPDVAQPMVDDLSQQAEDTADRGDLAALAALAVPPAVIAAVAAALSTSMLALAASSAGLVVAEAAAQGVTVAAPKEPGADRVAEVAEVTAALIASGYTSAATRKAMQVAGPGASAAEVGDAVRQTLTDMGAAQSGMVADNVGAGLSAAQNAGRAAVFESAKVKPKGYRAHETLDKNTCVNCAEADGREYPTLADALKDYPTGGLKSCLGGGRCRGFISAIWD